MRAFKLIGAGLAAGMLLAGCIAAVIGSAPNSGTVNDSRAGAAVEADIALESAVRGRFSADVVLRSLALEISAHGGTVTLRGTVATVALGARAVRAARAVAGVAAVNNQLKVN